MFVFGCSQGLLPWVLRRSAILVLFHRRAFTGDPELPYAIFGMSFALLFAGFESTKTIEQSRNLSLARLSVIEIVTQLLSLAVMLFCLLFQRNIWVLIAGSVSASLAKTILSFYFLSGTSNRWQWKKHYFIEIIHLGKWIFLSTSLYFFAGNGDRVLLGGMVDARTLGAYAIAYLFFSSIDQVLSRIIGDISFPALGEILRERPDELKRVYYRLHFIVATFAYACAGALFASAPAIIRTLYNQQYQAAGQILQILSIALLATPFRAATQTLLLLGAVRIYFVLSIARVIVLFAAVPVGFKLGGFTGAMWGIVFSFFANTPIIFYFAVRFRIFSLWREIIALIAIPIGYGGGITVSFLLSVLHSRIHP